MISAIVLLSSGAKTEMAKHEFSALGFGVALIAEGTLMITGDQKFFADFFKSKIDVNEGGAKILSDDGPTRTLPVKALPDSMQTYVTAIEFEAPIEFGPVDF